MARSVRSPVSLSPRICGLRRQRRRDRGPAHCRGVQVAHSSVTSQVDDAVSAQPCGWNRAWACGAWSGCAAAGGRGVCSPTVRIIAFQAMDPGSTPGKRTHARPFSRGMPCPRMMCGPSPAPPRTASRRFSPTLGCGRRHTSPTHTHGGPALVPLFSVLPIQSDFVLPIGGPRKRGSPKTLAMPVVAPSARYSLVKGERIVRSVLSARPHISPAQTSTLFYACPAPSSTQPYGTDACPALPPPTNPTCNLYPSQLPTTAVC
uniref:Uncharacterized protein n=1 Tax=Physcomitrium patens TaxID=3218 RepID=A0A2K1IJP1_PHYPA|nr:hypothetical protein PHYPA_028182 [Physcomitrium patens]